MSPHSGADGLVQAELPPTSPEFLTVFTSLACSPWRTCRVGEDCRPRTTWRPLTLAGSPALPPLRLTGGFCHADKTVPRQDVNSSFPSLRVPPMDQRCSHTRRFGTLAGPPPPVKPKPWGPHLPGHPLHSFRWKLRTSTYLGLEPYLPASKGCWCRELVKVEIRNLQSLLVCPIIL